MSNFKIGNITPVLGKIKAGSTNVTRIMNGAVQVWPELQNTWYFAVSLFPNGGDPPCALILGQARQIVGIDDTNVVVGATLYKVNGGNPIPLDAGNYRMSNNLQDGFTYDINTIQISFYYIEVNQFGTITAKFIC